jgi:GDPmannose 4,6-dehydratase
MTVNYREAHGMYACNGILFNHESPLRRESFVSRKITRGLTRVALGMQECLYLGNLDTKRDWGHARDYVEMQWLMLQQQEPEDFIIATGEQHSVRDFVGAAALELGIRIEWHGSGAESTGVVAEAGPGARVMPGQVILRVDPRHFRPQDIDSVVGDPSKARKKLGWKPKTGFHDLVKEMVRADLKNCLHRLDARGTTGTPYTYAD